MRIMQKTRALRNMLPIRWEDKPYHTRRNIHSGRKRLDTGQNTQNTAEDPIQGNLPSYIRTALAKICSKNYKKTHAHSVARVKIQQHNSKEANKRRLSRHE